MATGLMGGTFDPIHIAHLIIAEEALDLLGLSRVIFVPSARPPHKSGDDVASVEHRLEMVRLAIDGNPRLALSDLEVRRPEPSYTVETVRQFRRELGEHEKLYFIMGADSLAQFFTWKDPLELISSCEFVVVPRPGVDPAMAIRASGRKHTCWTRRSSASRPATSARGSGRDGPYGTSFPRQSAPT